MWGCEGLPSAVDLCRLCLYKLVELKLGLISWETLLVFVQVDLLIIIEISQTFKFVVTLNY